MGQALLGVDTDTHLHVSLSTSSTPRSRPASARRCAAGPNLPRGQLCMEMIADSGRLSSLT